MDSKKLSVKIAEIITHNISKDVKPVNYLMKLLNVGLDSAYRRLKGEIPYTFEEMAKLSIDLGFSIDKIIGEEKEDNLFLELLGKSFDTPEESLYKTLSSIYSFSKKHHNAKESTVTITMNRLQLTHTIAHEHLFKFFYYKWMHQVSRTPLKFPFSGLNISPQITVLRKKIIEEFLYINNQAYIIDPQMMLNTVKGIQYYYKRHLVSQEEVSLIKQDLFNYLDYAEKVAQEGFNSVGSKVDVYISTLNIETNSNYSNCDDNIESHFWCYSIIPIMSNSLSINIAHKRWLESIKKYAVLITGSNEMLQSEVFRKAKEQVEEYLQ